MRSGPICPSCGKTFRRSRRIARFSQQACSCRDGPEETVTSYFPASLRLKTFCCPSGVVAVLIWTVFCASSSPMMRITRRIVFIGDQIDQNSPQMPLCAVLVVLEVVIAHSPLLLEASNGDTGLPRLGTITQGRVKDAGNGLEIAFRLLEGKRNGLDCGFLDVPRRRAEALSRSGR